jgi:hypothetical protein
MGSKIIHSLVCDNGGILTNVTEPNIVNMSQPNIYAADDAKLYEIGTKWEFNGRVYHYACAAGTIGGNLAVKPYNHQDVGYSVAAATSAVGASSITVTTDVNDNLAGVAAKDELKGGVCVIFEKTLGVGYEQIRGITGNDALAAYGSLKIYLDAPLTQAFTVAVGYAEATASPWAKVAHYGSTVLNGGVCSACGVPTCYATTGQYLWVQTWGPCWVSPSATAGVGDNNRGLWFQGDGSITDQDASLGNLGSYAGWTIANDHASTQGAPFFYLQIAR